MATVVYNQERKRGNPVKDVLAGYLKQTEQRREQDNKDTQFRQQEQQLNQQAENQKTQAGLEQQRINVALQEQQRMAQAQQLNMMASVSKAFQGKPDQLEKFFNNLQNDPIAQSSFTPAMIEMAKAAASQPQEAAQLLGLKKLELLNQVLNDPSMDPTSKSQFIMRVVAGDSNAAALTYEQRKLLKEQELLNSIKSIQARGKVDMLSDQGFNFVDRQGKVAPDADVRYRMDQIDKMAKQDQSTMALGSTFIGNGRTNIIPNQMTPTEQRASAETPDNQTDAMKLLSGILNAVGSLSESRKDQNGKTTSRTIKFAQPRRED